MNTQNGDQEPSQSSSGTAQSYTAPRKFRVWYGARMLTPPHDYLIGGNGQVLYRMEYESGSAMRMKLSPRDAEVMFYAGLTDAKDTEIYEGDIIEHDAAPRLDVVVFERGCFRPETQEHPSSDWGSRWAVIGNRYENPELLKGAV